MRTNNISETYLNPFGASGDFPLDSTSERDHHIEEQAFIQYISLGRTDHI